MEKKLWEVFIKKDCKKLIKKTSELKKYLKGKEINYMSNGKDITTHLIAGLIKRILEIESVFPPYRSHRSDIKVGLDLSNYVTKTD